MPIVRGFDSEGCFYRYGDTGKPYPSINVDCTGGSADISVVY